MKGWFLTLVKIQSSLPLVLDHRGMCVTIGIIVDKKFGAFVHHVCGRPGVWCRGSEIRVKVYTASNLAQRDYRTRAAPISNEWLNLEHAVYRIRSREWGKPFDICKVRWWRFVRWKREGRVLFSNCEDSANTRYLVTYEKCEHHAVREIILRRNTPLTPVDPPDPSLTRTVSNLPGIRSRVTPCNISSV